jgi:hypothetical protein
LREAQGTFGPAAQKPERGVALLLTFLAVEK